MPCRLLIVVCLASLITLACSGNNAPTPQPSGEALLTPDTAYTFLLQEQMLNDTAPGLWERTEYILIHNGTTRHFTDMRSPAISRLGHFTAIDATNSIVLFYPGEDEHFAIQNSNGENPEFPTGSFGISPSGKRLYRVVMNQVKDDAGIRFKGELIEFNTDLKRDAAATDFFEVSTVNYDEVLYYSYFLSLPLFISETGAKVVFMSPKIIDEHEEDNSNKGGQFHSDVTSHSGSPYDFFIFDRETSTTSMLYRSSSSGYEDIMQTGISADGNRIVYFPEQCDVLFQDNLESTPEVIIHRVSGYIETPRISPEGGRIAYFWKASSIPPVITEATVMYVSSKREDVLLRLVNVSDAFWSDDLKYVGYIFDSKDSALNLYKMSDKSNDKQYYLHLVDINTREDTVVYQGREGYKLKLLDILAPAEGFEDSTRTGPQAFGGLVPDENEESGSNPKRKNVKKVKGKSPSVSSD